MAFWNRSSRNDETPTEESQTPEDHEVPQHGENWGEEYRGGPQTDENEADPDRDDDGDAEPTAHVGACSDCGEPLPRSNVVIEYETGAEWVQVAVCPDCEDLAIV